MKTFELTAKRNGKICFLVCGLTASQVRTEIANFNSGTVYRVIDETTETIVTEQFPSAKRSPSGKMTAEAALCEFVQSRGIDCCLTSNGLLCLTLLRGRDRKRDETVFVKPEFSAVAKAIGLSV